MDYYTRNADRLFESYQALDPENVHRAWIHLLPVEPGRACDIGAGSGRDAAWLATLGWDVTAVEPSKGLRDLGRRYTDHTRNLERSITWLDDFLPNLELVHSLNVRFHLILISAVWMHLHPAQHKLAMQRISSLLEPAGILVISVRDGKDAADRCFYPADANQLVRLASDQALGTQVIIRQTDLTRKGIGWDCLAFKKCVFDEPQITSELT